MDSWAVLEHSPGTGLTADRQEFLSYMITKFGLFFNPFNDFFPPTGGIFFFFEGQ